jgi:hypothetical protein
MTATPVERVTADSIAAALFNRHEPGKWFTAGEVTMNGRRLDVIAFGIWPSCGWELIGYEIKVARSDWMRELQQHEKSLEWFNTCDQFYLVSTPGVVKAGEVPQGWGHLECVGGRLFNRQQCVKRRDVGVGMPREIVARLLRALLNQNAEKDRLDRAGIRSEIEAELQRRWADDQTRMRAREKEVESCTTELRQIKNTLNLWSEEATRELGDRLQRLRQFEAAVASESWGTSIRREAADLQKSVARLLEVVKVPSAEGAT